MYERVYYIYSRYVPPAAKYRLSPKVANFAKRIFCVIYIYAMLTQPTTK